MGIEIEGYVVYRAVGKSSLDPSVSPARALGPLDASSLGKGNVALTSVAIPQRLHHRAVTISNADA
jgi:hypothetical protein